MLSFDKSIIFQKEIPKHVTILGRNYGYSSPKDSPLDSGELQWVGTAGEAYIARRTQVTSLNVCKLILKNKRTAV